MGLVVTIYMTLYGFYASLRYPTKKQKQWKFTINNFHSFKQQPKSVITKITYKSGH